MKVNPCADVMMRLLNALEASDVSNWFGKIFREKERKQPRRRICHHLCFQSIGH